MGKFFFLLSLSLSISLSICVCVCVCVCVCDLFASYFFLFFARAYLGVVKNNSQNASDDTYGFPFLIHGDGLRYSYARWILVLTINPI